MKETPYATYHRPFLPVSLVKQYFWCETQLVLDLVHGKVPTDAMLAGTTLHQQLHAEITVLLPVDVATLVDSLYMNMYNLQIGCRQIQRTGLTREFPIYGQPDRLPLCGIVDELVLSLNRVVVIENKTRQMFKLPSTAQTRVNRFQVQCYRLLLQYMHQRQFGVANLLKIYELAGNECPSERFLASLEVGSLRTLFQGVSLEEFCHHSFARVRKLLPISNHLCIRYIHASDGRLISEDWFKFDEAELLADLRVAAAYWFGERQARPATTEEPWKCRNCTYHDRCPE